MTRITFTKTFAWLAVLTVLLSGEAFAQATKPSLVTQQMRLSDGTGSYINVRAGISGIPSDNIPYFLDQAPPVDATKGYSLWLNGADHIVTSDPFVAGATTNQFWLERVKANGTGLEWVDPASLVRANNGLSVDNVTTPGSPTVQIGGPLIKTSSIDQSTFNMSFVNTGATASAFNLGAAGGVLNVNIDPTATGNININNMQADLTATDFLVLDVAKNVKTRSLASLVVADNGLSINAIGGFVELGGPVTGTNPLLVDRFVTLGGKNLSFDGSGDFHIGDGVGTQNITLDPGAAGSTNLKNLAPDAAPLATDRFVMMGAGNDKAFTRALTTLVNADNGLVVDNAVTPGTSTVQLGSPAIGGAPLLVNRYVSLGGGFALNFEGTGTYNIGTGGNMAFNVNTVASDMTLQGTNLASPAAATPAVSDFHNFAYVNSTTNVVHTITAANMARNDLPVDFVAIDPATGNFVKAISPTAGIYRGHTAWTGGVYTQTITLPGAQTILAGASVTATNENHTGEGTVAIQVTNVTTGAGGSFTVEASDILPNTSFINWVIINP
jgi:hypothetical protein